MTDSARRGTARSTFRRSWSGGQRPFFHNNAIETIEGRSRSTTARRSTNPRRASRWPSSTPRGRHRTRRDADRGDRRLPASHQPCSRTSGKHHAAGGEPPVSSSAERARLLTRAVRETDDRLVCSRRAFTPTLSLTSTKHDACDRAVRGHFFGRSTRRPSGSRRKREHSSSNEDAKGEIYDLRKFVVRWSDERAPVGQRVGAVRAKETSSHSDRAVAGRR